MTPPFRFADIRGARLAWNETGRGSSVVWAHGLTSRSYAQEASGQFDWKPVGRRHRLIRYDARGHGRSSGAAVPEQYTWPELGQDLLGLLDVVAPGEVCGGIGASMGAATLLFAALADPARFDRLVLVTPPTMGETRRHQMPVRLASADLVERDGKAALERLSVDAPSSPALTSARRHASPIEVRSAVLPSVLRGSALSDGPSDERLASISCPTLVLSWTGDGGHPVSIGEHLAATLPDATLSVAHSPAELRAWAERVVDFLS